MHASPRPWFWALGALLPFVASATSIVPHTLQQRAQVSDRVALVQVLSRHVEGDERHLKTVTEVAVGEDVRGGGPSHLKIVQIGGSLNGYEVHVPGDASFDVGEVTLVFLSCDAAGSRCALTAMGEGKVQVNGEFAVVHDLFTGQYARRSLRSVLAEIREAGPGPTPPVTTTVKEAP